MALLESHSWYVGALASARASNGRAHSKRPRILVIDDEPLIGSLIARVLGRGYDVVTVAQAQAGLNLLAEPDDFDLVLCDLMMPDLTGMHWRC